MIPLPRHLPRGRALAGLAPLLVLLAFPPAASGATASAQAPAAAHREVVPFTEDDFDKALAEAKKRNVPLIVDAWATWCHACRSMRAYVFTDPAVAPLADR